MNLTLKDILGIVGPIGTLMLIMWHHFNSSLHNLRGDLTRVDEKLSGKIDAVRDRVSRIEGLLMVAKIMPPEIMPIEEIKSKEVTDQKELLKDTKGATVSYA